MKKKRKDKVVEVIRNLDGTMDIITEKGYYKNCYITGVSGIKQKKSDMIVEEEVEFFPIKKEGEA